jgi:hypothetical protein
MKLLGRRGDGKTFCSVKITQETVIKVWYSTGFGFNDYPNPQHKWVISDLRRFNKVKKDFADSFSCFYIVPEDETHFSGLYYLI